MCWLITPAISVETRNGDEEYGVVGVGLGSELTRPAATRDGAP